MTVAEIKQKADSRAISVHKCTLWSLVLDKGLVTWYMIGPTGIHSISAYDDTLSIRVLEHWGGFIQNNKKAGRPK